MVVVEGKGKGESNIALMPSREDLFAPEAIAR